MNLVKLAHYFLVIVDEGHFGHAARRLGMTQPPLSQALQRLEAELGVRLLDRGPRGVTLTEAGEALLPIAHALLDAEDRLRQTARAHAASPGLRLGVVPGVPDPVAVELAGACSHGMSDGEVSLQTAATSALVNAVTAGRLDIAIVHHPAALHNLDASNVVSVSSSLLIPLGDFGAANGSHRLRDLVRRPLAVAPKQFAPAVHDLIEDTLLEHGISTGTIVAEDERAALALVATGQACALTGDIHRTVEGVARIPLPIDTLPMRFRVIWRTSLDAHGLAEVGHQLAGMLQETMQRARPE